MNDKPLNCFKNDEKEENFILTLIRLGHIGLSTSPFTHSTDMLIVLYDYASSCIMLVIACTQHGACTTYSYICFKYHTSLP